MKEIQFSKETIERAVGKNHGSGLDGATGGQEVVLRTPEGQIPIVEFRVTSAADKNTYVLKGLSAEYPWGSFGDALQVQMGKYGTKIALTQENPNGNSGISLTYNPDGHLANAVLVGPEKPDLSELKEVELLSLLGRFVSADDLTHKLNPKSELRALLPGEILRFIHEKIASIEGQLDDSDKSYISNMEKCLGTILTFNHDLFKDLSIALQTWQPNDRPLESSEPQLYKPEVEKVWRSMMNGVRIILEDVPEVLAYVKDRAEIPTTTQTTTTYQVGKGRVLKATSDEITPKHKRGEPKPQPFTQAESFHPVQMPYGVILDANGKVVSFSITPTDLPVSLMQALLDRTMRVPTNIDPQALISALRTPGRWNIQQLFGIVIPQ